MVTLIKLSSPAYHELRRALVEADALRMLLGVPDGALALSGVAVVEDPTKREAPWATTEST